MNFALYSMLWSITATVVVGILIIAVLLMEYQEFAYLIGAVVVGGLISLPIAYVLTRKISHMTQ